MIFGVGIDLVEIGRIRDSHTRLGARFAERYLRQPEIDYCLSHKDPGPSLAARFAAKEAAAKAFGVGIGAELGWHDMEVVRVDSGAPTLKLHGAGAELFAKRGGSSIHLSLSHTDGHAIAVVILEKS